jgi:tetratricopeptide (TPR) repeat protein
LQIFNISYYVTDMPDELSPDALENMDDATLHLFYAHGSFHRRSFANTTEQIQKLKTKNSRFIKEVIKDKTVIVLGHSGWDDCITAALNDGFTGELYWVKRSQPEKDSNLEKLLDGIENAKLVLADADNFMARLHQKLFPDFPFTKLLQAPIDFVSNKINMLNLDAVDALEIKDKVLNNTKNEGIDAKSSESIIVKVSPDEFKENTLKRLSNAKEFYEKETKEKYWQDMLVAYSSEDWNKLINACDKLLNSSTFFLLANERARALNNRGVAYGRLTLPKIEKAIDDYTAVIAMPNAPADQKATALFNRGFECCELTPPEREKAIDDYTAVIAMPDAPADQKATALFNRGVRYGELTPPEREKAIDDYTAVIAMPDAPADQKANALNNRGVAYGKLTPPEHEKGIAD